MEASGGEKPLLEELGVVGVIGIKGGGPVSEEVGRLDLEGREGREGREGEL